MNLSTPPRHIALTGLRVIKTVAALEGDLQPVERGLIEAVMRQLLALDEDIDALPTITPQEAADAVAEPEFRERFVRGAAMIAFIDGDADEAEIRYLTELGKACEVKDPNLRSLKHFRSGRMRLLRFDLGRRFIRTDLAKNKIRDDGLLAFLRAARTFLGKHEEPELAARYRALAHLPEGTLGRAYHHFIRDGGLAFPGEVGGFPDMIVVHDCMHVLAEYANDSAGEALISAFHGGQHREDLFSNVLFGILQFHLGVTINGAVHTDIQGIEPERLVEAFVRGTKCKGDPIREFKPHEHWHRTLDEIRRELNIVPRS